MHRWLALVALVLNAASAAMPPDPDWQLAREIFKEMIEIR